MTTKLVAALLALCAGSAMAVTYPDSITAPLNPTPDDADPSYAFASVAPRQVNLGQYFNDYYTFHLSQVSDVTFSVTSDSLFSPRGALLKQAVFDVLQVSGSKDFLSMGNATGDTHATFAFEKLGPGDYTINLLGHATGSSGGNYYGNFGVTAAVPEPQALALLLAGLSVVGLSHRVRRKA